MSSDRPVHGGPVWRWAGRVCICARPTRPTPGPAPLAAAGACHGTLITADAQSAGRGRQGRTWSAPAGRALLGSLIVRDPPRLLPLAAGVAVAEVAGRRPAQVKWPNDVLIDGAKVAGILVEGRPQENWAVVGIGLNVAVRESDFPAGAPGPGHDPGAGAGGYRVHPGSPAAIAGDVAVGGQRRRAWMAFASATPCSGGRCAGRPARAARTGSMATAACASSPPTACRRCRPAKSTSLADPDGLPR